MRKQIKILIIIFIAGMIGFHAVKVQARGVLLKVDNFVPAVFYPQSDTVTVLSYSVIKNSNLTLRIYDFLGRRVFEKKLGFFYQGRYGFVWDGRDAQGNIVKPGFYKCEIIAGLAIGQDSDNDYTVINVVSRNTGMVRDAIKEGTPLLKDLPFKLTGFVRGIT